MRKLLLAVLGTSLVMTLVYGAIGTGAAFTDHGTISQTVTMGGLTLRISSTTPDAVLTDNGHTLTCPAVWFQQSSASGYGSACRFKIETLGMPGDITVSATTTSTPGMENDKIMLGRTGGGGYETLPLADTVLFEGFGLVDDGVFFSFSDLTNASAHGTVNLVLSIDATEAAG